MPDDKPLFLPALKGETVSKPETAQDVKWQPASKAKKSINRMSCFKCHEKGHVASNCPVKKGDPSLIKGKSEQHNVLSVSPVASASSQGSEKHTNVYDRLGGKQTPILKRTQGVNRHEGPRNNASPCRFPGQSRSTTSHRGQTPNRTYIICSK